MKIFHITEPEIWQAAQQSGSYTGSTRDATLDDVGYIHCSFAEQVERVRGFVYDGYPGALVVLEIDTDRLDAPVRVENLDGGDELFPHIYGPIPLGAVVAVRELTG